MSLTQPSIMRQKQLNNYPTYSGEISGVQVDLENGTGDRKDLPTVWEKCFAFLLCTFIVIHSCCPIPMQLVTILVVYHYRTFALTNSMYRIMCHSHHCMSCKHPVT